jgi:outer membrane protein assembly factor BamA
LGFRVRVDSVTRASSLSSYAAATAKGHAKSHLQLDRWSGGNSGRQRIRLEYLSYPLPFFGLGPETPDSAEEWYSSGVTTGQFFTEHEWRRSVYLHAGLRYVRSRLRETEASGALRQGLIAGSSGSDVVSTELGLVIDSRDNLGSPRTGTYARLLPSVAARALGGDHAFRRLTIDARRYQTFGEKHVAAFQVQYDALAGTAPFDQMPMIGADTAMRGYPRGRYRDQHALTAQAEVRSAHWRRVGVVAFAGAGTVAPEFSKLGTRTWYPSVGAGVRYVLSPRERTVARLDLGIGRGSFGISVGIGEAF